MNGPDFQYDGLTAFAPITRAATPGKKGLMSAADKAKLDTLAATVNRLGFQYTLDQFSNTPIAAVTWTDCVAAQTFTLGSASNWLAFEIKLGLICNGAVGQVSARLNVDGGTVAFPFSAAMIPVAGGWTVLNGTTVYFPPGTLAAGSHTVKIQMWTDQGCGAYLRCATHPNTDFLTIRVVEFT